MKAKGSGGGVERGRGRRCHPLWAPSSKSHSPPTSSSPSSERTEGEGEGRERRAGGLGGGPDRLGMGHGQLRWNAARPRGVERARTLRDERGSVWR